MATNKTVKDENVEVKQEEKVQVGFSVEQIAALTAVIKAEVIKEMEEKETKRVAELDAKAKEEEAQAEIKLAESERKMKDRLLSQPKKTIFIPEDPNSPTQAIAVNGVIFSVKKGEYVEVPESVAEAWNYSYNATRAAEAKMKVIEVPSLTVSE